MHALSSLPAAVPARLLGALPLGARRPLIEPWLNHCFATPLAEGEFDELEGRRVSLAVTDLRLTFTLELSRRRLRLTAAPGEATIRGGWREFLCLATRGEDPDSLFFQRRLSLEGDTELGLMVKNLLDGLEEGVVRGRLGECLTRLDRLVRREP